MPDYSHDGFLRHISNPNTRGTLSELLSVSDFAERTKLADQIAEHIGKELKPTQLRKIFNPIKEIARDLELSDKKPSDRLPDEIRARVAMLHPPLAYARGRKLIPEDFYNLITSCMNSSRMQIVADFQILDNFITSILAYHKYYESKK